MLDELLAMCAATPLDDDPRLVYADAAGGVRGELIAVQCALDRGRLRPEIAASRRRRETEILAEHGTAFSELDGLAIDFVFRRGFVDSVRVDAAVFAERGEELFRRAPLTTVVELDGLSGRSEEDILQQLDAALASPSFARIQTLRLPNVGRWVDTESDYNPRDFEAAGAAVLARLIAGGAFATLRGLEMPSSGLSGSHLRELGECAEARGLQSLDVRYQDIGRYTGLDSNDIAALVAAPYLDGLHTLDVGGALGHGPMLAGQTREERKRAARAAADRDAALLAHPRIRTLKSLGIARGSFSEAMIDALAGSTFTRLERIDLSRNDLFAADWTRIGPAPGFANVRELLFDGPCEYVFDAKMATALGAATFPALRALRVRNNLVRVETAEALLASPLAARLELLDLRRNRDLAAHGARLQTKFGGILLHDEA